MTLSPTLVLLCLIILPGHNCRQWSSSIPDGAVKYTCTGGTAIFPWVVSLAPGEEITDIQWFFQGPESAAKEMIGVYVNGIFFSQPSFSDRVLFMPNAGISVSHVTAGDAGNYSVEIRGRNSNGDYFSLSEDNYLDVLDGSPTTDGSLHVHQESSPVYDNVTGEWSVELTCGTFVFGTNRPPFDVQWTTPSGNTVQSSYYDNGKFHLLLSLPIDSGTYTCQPADQAVCFHGNTTHSLQASVVIDDVKARLAILETKVQSCCDPTETPGGQTTDMTQDNIYLQNQNALLLEQMANLTEQNNRLVQQHEQQVQTNAQLSQQLQTLTEEFTHFKNDHLATHDAQHAETHGQNCCTILEQTVQSLASQMQNDTSELTQQLHNHNIRLDNVAQQCSDLSHRVSAVESAYHSLTSASQSGNSPGPRISFHARMQGCQECSCPVNHHQAIPFPRVSHNDGGGYDNHTTFRAPVSGTYFFLASAETSDGGNNGGMYLIHGPLNGQHAVLDFVYLYDYQNEAAGSVHAVLHLGQNEKVWVQNIHDHDSRFRCSATDFSGFLLSRD